MPRSMSSPCVARDHRAASAYNWPMLSIRIAPKGIPSRNVSLLRSLASLLARTASMGILPSATMTQLDTEALQRVLDALQDEHLVSSSALDLEPLLRLGPELLEPGEAAHMQAAVDRIVEILGESPSPATEWPAMREVFGDDALSRLVGVSESSLRRYASAARNTPQAVAERLHWLAMVVADLAGAYNHFGIRRWFERPRAQLGGKSPRQVLGQDWAVDDEATHQVRALASVLTGAQALAA